MVLSELERSPLHQFLMDFRSHVSPTLGKCEDPKPEQEAEVSSADDTASPGVISPTSSNSPPTYTFTPIRKPKKCCNYCRSIGKSWHVCKSHATLDCNGVVQCRHLQTVACPLAGAFGHGVHTVRECHLQYLVRYTVDRYSLVRAYPPVYVITVWYDDPWYSGYFSTCQYSMPLW